MPRARDLLVERKQLGGPAMTNVAAKLELSVHALRRRLSTEGKPFNLIANEAFAIMVRQHLLDRRYTIQIAAYELGSPRIQACDGHDARRISRRPARVTSQLTVFHSLSSDTTTLSSKLWR